MYISPYFWFGRRINWVFGFRSDWRILARLYRRATIFFAAVPLLCSLANRNATNRWEWSEIRVNLAAPFHETNGEIRRQCFGNFCSKCIDTEHTKFREERPTPHRQFYLSSDLTCVCVCDKIIKNVIWMCISMFYSMNYITDLCLVWNCPIVGSRQVDRYC